MRPRKHPAARTPMHTRRTRCIARTPTRRPVESSGLEKNDKVTTVHRSLANMHSSTRMPPI